MKEDFSHLSDEERIRAENNILKMKLMLEKGARFHEHRSDLPAEIEHEFLKQVIAFEKQIEEHKMISVVEKLGNPTHFKPVADIPDAEFGNAWEELDRYMRKHNINLDVCSPNISEKELYRFTIEELFRQEMDDFNLPGMTYCFIYDEFHPDPMYENSHAAMETIRSMLNPTITECLPHLRRRNLRLNNRLPLTEEEFRWYVNQFKQAYECMDKPEIEETECTVSETYSLIRGSYRLRVSLQTEYIVLQGNWTVELELDGDLGYWYIFNVQVEGINF
jgi:hypothetical protein